MFILISLEVYPIGLQQQISAQILSKTKKAMDILISLEVYPIGLPTKKWPNTFKDQKAVE